MTEPGEAIEELVRQHDALRAAMDDCEQQANDVDRGRGDIAALARGVARLREQFETHNRFEEHVLRPLLRMLGTSGDRRIGYMVADHVDEHRALRHRLDGPTAELRATLYELRSHLAAEERTLLSARVIRDDVIEIDATG